MNGFTSIVNGFSQEAIDALVVKADELYITESWTEVTATLATLATTVASVSEPTKIIVTDTAPYHSSITLDNNAHPVWIIAETPLSANMQRSMFINGNDITIDGFLFDGWTENASNLYGVRFEGSGGKITRCRFDNFKASRWVYCGLEAYELEVSYNDFWNLIRDADVGVGTSMAILQMQDRDGTVTTTPQNIHIHHNYFKNQPDNGTLTQSVMIYTDEYSDANPSYASPWNTVYRNNGSIFEYNLFEDVGKTTSIKQNDVIQRYNTVMVTTVDGKTSGLKNRWGTGCKMYGNTILCGENKLGHGLYSNGRDVEIYNNFIRCSGVAGVVSNQDDIGIQILTENDGTESVNLYGDCDNTMIAFNTFVNVTDRSAIRFRGVGAGLVSPTGITVNNNICIQADAEGLVGSHIVSDTDGSTFNIDANTYAGNIWLNGTLGAFVGEAGFDNTDPQLTEQADERFVPTAGSYCLAKASADDATITQDLYGQNRPSSRAVGSSEIVVVNNNPVLTPSDVGIDT